MITIENDQLIVEINEQGAELTSVQNKDDRYEYIWNDKAWPKHAPILFPAIGRSVDDQYLIDEQKYEMPQHGFAALYEYDVVEKTENSVIFSLTDNQETLAMYPFHFNLIVKFELNDRDLQVSFEIENKNTQELSFSLGFHPAFNIPMASNEKFEDYSLELLPKKSTLQQYEIVKTPNPYRSGKVVDFVESGSTFKLNRKIFEKGLVIFDEDIDEVRLFSKEHQVSVIMNDFSNLCIWTKEDTDLPFLCIEPFYGLPDQVNKMQELANKEGNYHLKADSNALFNCTIKFQIVRNTIMKKMEILNKLEESGVVAVVRGNSKDEVIKACQAITKGGLTGIELTFTVPQAEQVIKELKEIYQNQNEVVIGAGTVLDATTARIAILAGAEFVVSPCFDLETAKICNLYQIPYIPGFMTITEAKEALKAGADIVKLFPGNAFGSGIVKAFKAPLPQLNIMPTGGVSLENMQEWFDAGVIAVGVGGNLLAPLADQDFKGIEAMAHKYATKFHEIKG